MSRNNSETLGYGPFKLGLTLWDIKTLSECLAIKTSTLYAWVEQGKIPVVRIRRLIRFRPEDISEWLAECPSVPPKGSGRSIKESLKYNIYNYGALGEME